MSDYKFLQPYTFEKKGIVVKNRIVIPPMTEEMSFANGEVTSDELRYYNIHSGGAGMYITGTSNVNSLGKGFEGELSSDSDKFLPSLTKLEETYHYFLKQVALPVGSSNSLPRRLCKAITSSGKKCD